MNRLTATVTEADQGRKIQYFVRGNMGVSYRQFSALKTWNGLHVNGEIVHANYLIRPGDFIEVFLEEAEREGAIPEDLPINVVWEDNELFIIDKTAPLACQASSKHPTGTLENRAAFRYRDVPNFVFRPLNRLDKGTSGLMAAAKYSHACQRMQQQLHTDSFVREYLAVVEGTLEGEGTIDLPIAKEADATVRRIIDFGNGKRAVTHYRAVSHGNGRTLVRLRLETGRTHQIRVHLSHMGYPICGDFLYGTELPELPQRFALHSAYIRLEHPITGEVIEQTSELPPELQKLLQSE